jgi:cell division protein FtsQ
MRPLTARMAGMAASRPFRARRAPGSEVLRDPAPSRLAYRLDRLWLTPVFRSLVRVGVPVFVATLAIGVYLADPARRAEIGRQVADLREGIAQRPEFMVRLMSIEGASPAVAEGVRKMLPVRLPESSLNLDLEAMRAAITQIDAIEGVDLRIRPGGVLDVMVRERVPAVLWRTAGRLEMLDATGHRVATLVDRAARPDLPVIAGEGADAAVDEALRIFAAAGPLEGRLRGLTRVGARRWDVVLDRGQVIQLPQDGAIDALGRVIVIDQSQDLLARDVTVVDMRLPDRPTVRLAASAAEDLRKTRETLTKVSAP